MSINIKEIEDEWLSVEAIQFEDCSWDFLLDWLELDLLLI